MPSLAPLPQRRRRAVEPESDSNSHDSDMASRISRDGTPFSQASNGSKRIRLSAPDDDDENDENDASSTLEEDSDDRPARANRTTKSGNTLQLPVIKTKRASQTKGTSSGRRTNPHGNESNPEHRPGSIVRVKLTDFVTYTSAEFFPGPRLNMVIGPNGTGKSTLHLGRAKDPAEFVKHGCEEAIIEIELAKGRDHRENPVIRRTIVRKGNKSTFTINGKPSSKASVLELAKSFSIQIDNLCQFLPQDKVAEFAALSPIELLHSTQRAAAGPEMLEWHENLKTLRAEQKKLQAANAGEREQLANLESRQEMQREDVERLLQRVRIQKKIALLERSRPVPRYQEAVKSFREAQQKRRELQQEHGYLENDLAPALKSVNDKKEYLNSLQAVAAQKRDMVTTQEGVVADSALKLEKAQESIQDLDAQIEAEKKAAKTHRENFKKSQQIINKLTRQMEEEPVEYDAAAYTEKIRETVRNIRDIEEEMRNVDDAKNKASRDQDITTEKISKGNERLESLNTESGRQEEKLKHLSADTAKAWVWIKANQPKFQKRVFGPPLVECSVKDPTYVDAMESLLQRTDLLTFTVQTLADFKMLQQTFSKELGLHDISMKVSSVTLSDLRTPITDEELRALGFDCWAKDLLAGPEPVVAMLCSENRLNQTPIARRDITDEEHTRMTNSPISNWVTGRQSYQVVRRREYGPSAVSTRVRPLRHAQFWTNRPADLSAKSTIVNGIKELQREADTLQEVIDEHKNTLENLRRRHRDAQEQKRNLESEKSAKQTALTLYKTLPTKKAQQEEKLRASEGAIRGVRERVEALRDKQDQLSLEKAAVALEYANRVDEFQHLIEDLALAEVNLLEAVSDLDTLQERNTEVNKTLKSKKAEVEEAIKECAKIKQQFDKCRKDFMEFVDHINADPEMQTEELRGFVETIKSYSVDQLEADIDSEKAALELAGEGNTNVIKEFEQRQQRIDKLKDHLSEFQTNLNELDEAINEVRGKWEPKLEALVKQISDAFSESFARIGCAGQVSIDKAEDAMPEHGSSVLNSTQADNGNGNSNGNGNGNGSTSRTSDFDQWSIRIQVKFRENENLSVLDSHRQSGGERAVSTIFYLMALQSLSASPFRVVDEINQGMDPRNERMVHERMVDIACASGKNGEGGGQYFLITPKLLSGLKYKRGMKVLCIVSGEYVPEDYRQMDFGKCVLRMKAVLGTRGKGKGREMDTRRMDGVDVGA
ncbi:hypothetical protein EMPG_13211 [Blastomyces silverae]|uniref:Structural maintenance of chromosomes protein 5 n=1 Tax=Blastomyces silverae TaxID=2060906 RepID=A0A0H1BKE6_9EURO|nr:hypothetical protein EMPG_13211 [Blastomyces silverae]